METRMSELEILMWLTEIKAAKEGNLSAQNHLRAENTVRQEQNRPTVEEELRAIIEQAEQ